MVSLDELLLTTQSGHLKQAKIFINRCFLPPNYGYV